MSINSEILLNQYIPFNKPVPYKNYNIHALKLCDMYETNRALDMLQIDKNTLGQIEFISMSNLRFVLLLAEIEEECAVSLEALLRKVFNIPNNYVVENAEDKLKKIAAKKTSDNNNLGVEEVLKKI